MSILTLFLLLGIAGLPPRPLPTVTPKVVMTVHGQVFAEIPMGVQDGVNSGFTLSQIPNPPSSLQFYYNGVLLTQGWDYKLTGNTIGLLYLHPGIDDILQAFYSVAGSQNCVVGAYVSGINEDGTIVCSPFAKSPA